jgi:hypothetical protein
VFETWEINARIAEAKRLTERLVDHAHYLLDIRENNAIVVYSDQLSKQIPRSYAANAFNVFRETMHQIEIVRLSALWDPAQIDNETIPTVIELVDNDAVIKALSEDARAQYVSIPESVNPDESRRDHAPVTEGTEQKAWRRACAQCRCWLTQSDRRGSGHEIVAPA